MINSIGIGLSFKNSQPINIKDKPELISSSTSNSICLKFCVNRVASVHKSIKNMSAGGFPF